MHILVTGGGGFLGEAIVKALIKRNYTVRSIGRTEAKHLRPYGVDIHCGDLSNPDTAQKALEGVDAVIHTAAKAGIWGNKEDFYTSNVLATENLLHAAKKAGIRYFVYTSTPSVVIGKDDIHYGDESLGYAQPLCHYAASKAIAERAVCKARSPEFRTIALRPHLIWGEKDPHLVPTLIAKAKQGQLVQVGNGQNRVDLSHVDNVAWAHVLALDAIISGKNYEHVYFISDDAPVVLWDWIAQLLEALGLPAVSKRLSFAKAYAAGYVLEKLYAPFQSSPPPLTRFLAIQLGKNHYFNIQAIKKDLGYKPIQDPSEALQGYIAHLKATLKKD